MPGAAPACAPHKRAQASGERLRAPGPGSYSPIVSSEALPPDAVVLMVSVRSPAKRSR